MSGFNIKAFCVDNWNIQPAVFKAKWKDQISKNTILIVDGVALKFGNNEKVARIFDKKEIGGCLIPLCEKLDNAIKSYILERTKTVFEHLFTSVHEIMNDEYMNIELFVPTKELLFRRLSNIAIKHLEVFPNRVGWGEDLQQLKNDPLFNSTKASLNL